VVSHIFIDGVDQLCHTGEDTTTQPVFTDVADLSANPKYLDGFDSV